MASARASRYDGLVRFWFCILFTGCGITDFDITQPVPEQRIQGSGVPDLPIDLFKIPLDLDLQAQIEKQTTGPIDSVTLSSLELQITPHKTPQGDWSFVDNIHVFVKSSA